VEIGWNLWGTLPHFLPQQNQAAEIADDGYSRETRSRRFDHAPLTLSVAREEGLGLLQRIGAVTKGQIAPGG
jgi:hypothetical protein